MTNLIGGTVCAACIAGVEYLELPTPVSFVLIIGFGFLGGYLLTRKKNSY